MESAKNSYDKFVQETIKILQNVSDKNKTNQESIDMSFDSVIFGKVIDVISYVHSGPSDSIISDRILDIMKLVECKDLSFVEDCLVGNLKSVYNFLNKSDKTQGEQYKKFVQTFVQDVHSKQKLINTVTDMKTETQKIEEDLEIISGIISSMSKPVPMTKDEKTIKINNIIKIVDKVWTDEAYLGRIVNAVYPSLLESENNRKVLDVIVKNLCISKDSLGVFLDRVIDWKYPSNVTRRDDIIEIIKILFKRSSVLRDWKKDKTGYDIKERIKRISIILNSVIDYFIYNKEDFMAIATVVFDNVKGLYKIKKLPDNTAEYKKVFWELYNISQIIKQEITLENKNRLINACLNFWNDFTEATNLQELSLIITKDQIFNSPDVFRQLCLENFPLKETETPGLYDTLVEKCHESNLKFFSV